MQEVVLSSIDEGLDTVGENAKHVLYYYLQRKEKLRREDIVVEAEKFILLLRGIFGAGSAIIERNIMVQLQQNTKGRDLPPDFSRAVAELMKVCEC